MPGAAMDCSSAFLITLMALTMTLSACLTVSVRWLAWRWQVVDRPDKKRKLHHGRVPLWGGVAIYLAMSLGLLAAIQRPQAAGHPLSKLAMALIPAAGLACLFGALDDVWAFRSRRKLVLQFFSVLPVVLAGYWIDRIVVFSCPIALGWFGVPLTILWLIGCINALNLIDGMDGLASVVGLSTAGMMSVIAMSMGNPHVAVIAVVLAGAIGGFLVYNFPPASIFLGDSGSAVIGLMLGILGIQGAMKTSATLSITAPAVIMTLPMFDVVMAVVRRTLTGRRFDAADRQHIHHQLLDRGLSPWQVLCIAGAFCLTTGAAATAATVFRWDALAWIAALTLIVLVIRLRLFGHYEFALLKGVVVHWVRGGGVDSAADAAESEILQGNGVVVDFPPAEDRRKAA